MEPVLTLRARIAPLAGRVRWYRGIYWSTRFLLYSLLVALPLVLVKSQLPGSPGLWLLALLITGAGGGLVYGLCRPVPVRDVARFIEERLDLKARLSTALECHDRQETSPFAIALYHDALKALCPLREREVLPLRPPPGWWGLIPAAAAVLLLWLVSPVPWDRLDSLGSSSGTDAPQRETSQADPDNGAGMPVMVEPFRIRDRRWRAGRTPAARILGSTDSLFRDSPLAKNRPDFSSFLLGGDERMRLLGRSQMIPDLRGEGLRSPYEIMVQRVRQLAGGDGIRGLAPDEVRQLLSELRAVGKQGGVPGSTNSSEPAGPENLPAEGGRRALEEALEWLRNQEEAPLRSSEVRPAPGTASSGGPSGAEERDGESRFEERFGSLAGRGRSDLLRGDPTPRLGVSPEDTRLRGHPWGGSFEAYETNLLGAGEAGKPTTRPRAEILSRYRQITEEALSRESIPPDYREQVKTYFDSLQPGREVVP